MEPGGFGINNKRVGNPQLVHKPTVQSQSLVGVIVGQTVVLPALPQEHSHGIFLPGQTEVWKTFHFTISTKELDKISKILLKYVFSIQINLIHSPSSLDVL